MTMKYESRRNQEKREREPDGPAWKLFLLPLHEKNHYEEMRKY